MVVTNREDSRLIERAIVFLVENIQKSGNNPKPVILHSIRVGLYLLNRGYSLDVVIAGLLHDILEDTSVDIAEVRMHFGDRVARLVAANSFDPGLEESDKVQSYRESFDRCVKAGKEALIVKGADIVDNAPYYVDAPPWPPSAPVGWVAYGHEKISYFVSLARPYLGGETVLSDLENSLGHLLEARDKRPGMQ